MDAAAAVPIMSSSSLQVISRLKHPSNPALVINHQSLSTGNKPPPILLNRNNPSSTSRRLTAVYAISAIASDPAHAEITWQIAIGALAGVAPFVVAGIEFSKRIVAQRKCKVCKGSGLVLRDKKYYFRCHGCGGFLPWQSWSRFFTG